MSSRARSRATRCTSSSPTPRTARSQRVLERVDGVTRGRAARAGSLRARARNGATAMPAALAALESGGYRRRLGDDGAALARRGLSPPRRALVPRGRGGPHVRARAAPQLVHHASPPARAAPPACLGRHHPDPADDLAAPVRGAVQERRHHPRVPRGSYIEYLTPGVIVMTAISSAGWTGMASSTTCTRGVMDRMLVSPVWRSALNVGSLVYSSLDDHRPVADHRRRRRSPSGRISRTACGGVAVLILVACLLGACFRGVLERARARRAPGGDPDRRRDARSSCR